MKFLDFGPHTWPHSDFWGSVLTAGFGLIYMEVVVCYAAWRLKVKCEESHKLVNIWFVIMLCLLRLLHRKMSYYVRHKCQSNQSFIHRSIRSETFPEFDFLSGPVFDCSLAAWECEWCILSRLAQWLEIFINGDKRAGFNQNWGSIVLGHIDTNIARQDISDMIQIPRKR